MMCSDDYSFQTKNALAQLSEKEMSFELVEVKVFHCWLYFLKEDLILLVVHEIHMNLFNLSNITSSRSSSFLSINLKPKMKLF